MCGIFAEILGANVPPLPNWHFWAGTKSEPLLTSPSRSDGSSYLPSIENLLRRRGPDDYYSEVISLGESATLRLCQSVLSLRGCHEKENVLNNDNRLLYNGELYDDVWLLDNESDTEKLRVYLQRETESEALTPRILDRLQGPWTIVYWHAYSKRLYFAKDRIGRRSLLLRVVPGQKLTLSSVAPRDDPTGFVEVPPAGVAYIDLSGTPQFGLYRRETVSVVPRRALSVLRKPGSKYHAHLVSGSTVDMYASFLPEKWLRSLDRRHVVTMTPEQSTKEFISVFIQSVKRRLTINMKPNESQARFAVLFSGGIDSLFLSVILESCLLENEPLHLINVAFGKDSQSIQKCPDRITALQGLKEMRTLCSKKRRIEMLCVDVLPNQADYALVNNVRHLLHPCDQLMDASIGTAIWLASKGVGHRVNEDLQVSSEMVQTPARVLFSGLGADELMGGYKGRHRSIFEKGGIDGILREMDADLSRLWFRNLGRDDRLVCDHGKEVRHPFLDEDLVSFVTSLPLTEHVCDLSRPDGVGDKLLLRKAARMVGISQLASSRVKRAIQFGSRSRHILERKSSKKSEQALND